MKRLALMILLTSTLPAVAGVQEAVDDHILPGFAAFAEAAKALETAAQGDCRAQSVAPAYHSAFDAWMAVSDLRIGPSETGALSISFWPDDRGFTKRTLARLVQGEDPIGGDPDAYAEISIAARGFFAIEMLLYDPAFSNYGPEDYTCTLVQTVTTDLSRQAAELNRQWRDSFAATLTSGGAAGNTVYLTDGEAIQAIYTQMLGSLEFTTDKRIARPMGTFHRPRPKLAEAWRSQRSLRNILGAVDAVHDLARTLSGLDLPQTDITADRIATLATRIADPAFQDIDDAQERLRVEVLQQEVFRFYEAIDTEVGTALGIAVGFNAHDGD